MSTQGDFLSFSAEYMAGKRSAGSLIHVAADLVAQFTDPPDQLVALAAVSGADAGSEDFVPVLNEALEALNLPELTPERVATILIRDIARKIVNREIELYRGADQIWQLGRDYNEDGTYSEFVALTDEWESDLPGRLRIEEEIRQAASSLLVNLRNPTGAK